VTQLEILPEPPVERPDSTPWPMWPEILFKTHAHEEGGIRKWAVTTKAFLGENQVLQKLKCARVEWQEKNGRPAPVEVKGSEFEVKADLVILAMGYTGPGNGKLTDDFQIKLDERGNVWADKNHMTNVQSVFTAGDMSTGQSLVVKAIDGGRKAAEGIMRYLTGA
jgi:glutamate synthase (NADPH/NADH) small chain